MKSIKQQYIDLREGNMSQANFMRSIRMSLPQYVTNITSFNDTVKILKNKGILNENTKFTNPDEPDFAIAVANQLDNSELTDEQLKTAEAYLEDNAYDLQGNFANTHSVDGGSVAAAKFIANKIKSSLSENISSDDVMSLDVNLNRANPRDGFTLGFYEGKESTQITPEVIEVALENMWEEGLIDTVTWKTASKALPNFDIDGNTNMVGTSTADDLARELVFVATGNNVPDIVDYDDEEYKKAAEEDFNNDAWGNQERENRFNENKSLREAKDGSSEGKWKTVTGKELYAQFKEIDNLNGQEVLIGIDFEMIKNHKLSKLDAAKIVVKNLKKNSIYYTAQDMSGVEGYEIGYIGGKSADAEARQMQYLDKNMGNVVDKKMGMKPVKDVEKVKKDSNKGGETNKTVKGVSLMSLVAKSVRGLQKMDATGEKMKKITMKESYYDQFSSEKRGEKIKATASSEIHNGLKIGDNVKVDSEVANKLGISSTDTFTIKSFKKIRPGLLMQSVDAIIANDQGKTSTINIEYLYEAGKVANTIFNKNAGITAGLKSLTKDSLMEMIRKEIAGAYGGDQMSAEDGSSYINKGKSWTTTIITGRDLNNQDSVNVTITDMGDEFKVESETGNKIYKKADKNYPNIQPLQVRISGYGFGTIPTKIADELFGV